MNSRPGGRPSDAWRLVDAGSPLPRVGPLCERTSVPGTGSPAGAALRGVHQALEYGSELLTQDTGVHPVRFPMTAFRGTA